MFRRGPGGYAGPSGVALDAKRTILAGSPKADVYNCVGARLSVIRLIANALARRDWEADNPKCNACCCSQIEARATSMIVT